MRTDELVSARLQIDNAKKKFQLISLQLRELEMCIDSLNRLFRVEFNRLEKYEGKK